MADGSAANSGVPPLESLISLVSNSNMRYEGTMYHINIEESTLALKNVRFYGTEGRPADSFTPPSPDPYEYIVFKGSDIQSLDVKRYGPPTPKDPIQQLAEGGPPPSVYAQPNNPWGPPTSQAQPYTVPAPYGSSSWGAPVKPAPPASGPPQPPTPPAATSTPVPPAAPAHSGQPAPAPAPTVVVTPAGGQPRPMGPPHRPPGGPRPQGHRQPAWANAKPMPDSNAAPPGQPRPAMPPPPGFNGGAPQPRPRPQGRQGSNNTSNNASNNASSNSSRPAQRGPASYASAAGGGAAGPATPPGMMGGARPQRQHQAANGVRQRGEGSGAPRPPPPAAPPVPREDFNFQEALSKFDKDKIKEEAAQPEALPSEAQNGPVYVKDDFFDTISSDVLERVSGTAAEGGRGRGRGRFAEQRKLDMETFGGTGVARRNNRGRGRGRGGGGGGPGRGRGRSGGPNPSAAPAAVAAA